MQGNCKITTPEAFPLDQLDPEAARAGFKKVSQLLCSYLFFSFKKTLQKLTHSKLRPPLWLALKFTVLCVLPWELHHKNC